MTAPGGVIATVYVNVLPRIKQFGSELRKSLRASQRDLRALDRELKPVEKGFIRIGKVATGIVPGIKLTTLSLQALGGKAIVGGILAAAGAITTMSGALIALPGALIAAKLTMAAFAISVRGVQDALKKFDDPEKFAEELEKLSKNAQKTLGVLNTFRKQIESFRDSVQDTFFAGLDVSLRRLTTKLLPVAETHFKNLAATMNEGAKDLTNFVLNARTLKDINEITSNTEISFRSLIRGALIPAATAFRDIAVVGSRALPFLVDHVVRLIRRFQEFIAVARATGKLQTWMENGIAAVLQFFSILGNIGRSIRAILGAAQESGNSLLDTLEKLTDNLADFLESGRGQDFLAQFMLSAEAAARSLVPVIVELADLLFLHLLPVLEEFATTLSPAVAAFFSGLATALDVAAPGIQAFAQGFSNFINAIVPALPVIGALVGQIGMFIGILATEAGPAVADIVTALGNVLIPVIQALTAVIDFLGPAFLKVVAVIGTVVVVLGVLTTITRGVQTVMGLFAASLSLTAGAAMKTQGPVRGLLALFSGPWGLVIGAATLALGLFLSETDESSTAVDNLRNAMENATGSMEEAAREAARLKLEQDGVAQSAADLGIDINTLIDAYLGNAAAADQYSKAVVQGLDSGKLNIDQVGELLTVLKEGPTAYDEAKNAVERKRIADLEGAGALNIYADGINAVRTANELLRQEQQRQQDLQLAALNSQISYQKTLQRTTETVKNHSGALDINNTESLDALSALSELSAAGTRRVADLKAQKASTDVINTAIKQNQEAILGLITPFFKSKEAARAFAIQVGLIPKAPTVTPRVNDGPARAKLSGLRGLLSQLTTPRTVDVNVRVNAPAGGGGLLGDASGIPGRAAGGPLRAGQWSWVGEKGPELVQFSRAGRVFSNDESMDMIRNVGSLDSMTSNTRRMAVAASTPTKLEATVNVQTTPEVYVYIDGKEVRAIVKTELDDRDRKLVQLVDIGAGRRT